MVDIDYGILLPMHNNHGAFDCLYLTHIAIHAVVVIGGLIYPLREGGEGSQ